MSAAWNRPIKTELVAIGEVGLTGEIRATAGVQRRLTEAARLGFKQAIVPSTGSEDLKAVNGLTIYPVADLATAAKVGLTPPDNTGRKRKE